VKLFEIEPMLYDGAHSNITHIMVRLMASAIHFDNNQIVFMILYTQQCGCVLINPVSVAAGPPLDYVLFALSYF
jgi:hypothetical protein